MNPRGGAGRRRMNPAAGVPGAAGFESPLLVGGIPGGIGVAAATPFQDRRAHPYADCAARQPHERPAIGAPR